MLYFPCHAEQYAKPNHSVYIFSQERFWRVPGNLRPAELWSKVKALAPPPEGAAEASGDEAEEDTAGESAKKKKDKSKLKALKALVKERKKQRQEQNKENIEGGRRKR